MPISHGKSAALPMGGGGMKQVVGEILEGGGFTKMRAAKMTQETFLKLLLAFNEKDIHFHGIEA